MNGETIIPIFVPHQGCPFDCVFCNQRRITGVEKVDIKQTVISYLNEIRPENYKRTQIAFFGGSFTGIERDYMIQLLEEANEYINRFGLSGIRCSTRPDYINEEILNLLKKYKVKTIELGVQSLDDDVLRTSHRGHSSHDVIYSSQLIKDFNFQLGLQTMVGLPGDTLEKSLKTAEMIIDLKPSLVRIYPVLVLKDTGLEKLYKAGKYLPLDLDTAVEWCSKLVDLYEKSNIKIARIGLQTSESLVYSLITGPWHPAFGQLVADRRVYEKICNLIKGQQIKEGLIVVANKRLHSNVVGHKKNNVKKLKDVFGFKNIKVVDMEDEISDEGCTVCKISS